MARAKTEKKAEQLGGLKGEIEAHLDSVIKLVDKMTRARKAGDCRTALEHLQEAQTVFRAAGKRIAQASTIHEQLQRQALDLPVAIAAKKAAARACPIDRTECTYSIEGATCSVSAGLTVPARGGSLGTEKIPARYCLVEIGQLHTSHRPLEDFTPDPAYPPEAQERDYRQLAERAKVQEIARSYEPALIFNSSPSAIDGVPIATEGRVVLGGNGRTMATSLVYAGLGDVDGGLPRQYLVEHAHEFGLEPEAVEAMRHPMLVRTVRLEREDPRTLATWSRRLNVALSQQLDAVHLAVSRARFVGAETLRELSSMEEGETLASFLSSSRSRPFVRALQNAGVIDGRAAQTYLAPDGLLNDQGRELAVDLLVAALLPDADLIGAYGRGPLATLARSAPYLVQASEWAEYDLRKPLKLAIRDRITQRATSIPRVEDYLRQGGLFASSNAAVSGDDRGRVLLFTLASLEDSPAKFVRFSRRYLELAKPAGQGQAALFATEAVTPLEALERAASEAGVKVPRER